MNVFPKLSKNAWRVLLTLAEHPGPASQMAKENQMGLNRVSEALKQLERCNIIKARERRKPISLDASLKNALKAFLVQYPKEKLPGLLEGKKLNAAFQILDGYDTVEKLGLATGYSIPTLKRILRTLQAAFFVYQPRKGAYAVRDEFSSRLSQLRSSFFACFADSMEHAGIRWKQIFVFGDHVLIKSSDASLPGFVKTGFSVFHKYHVDLILTGDNYFVNDGREQTKEEIFVHALAFSRGDFRYMQYCVLFADLNGLTLKDLGNLPSAYKLEKEAAAVLDFIESKGGKTGAFLPAYEEYLSARRDYART
jgi:hypothetical protein